MFGVRGVSLRAEGNRGRWPTLTHLAEEVVSELRRRIPEGPYYIAGWTRNREVLVKENPNYTGSRPHHFDEIHYGIGLPLETIKLQIDQGVTDWGDIPPAAHADAGSITTGQAAPA